MRSVEIVITCDFCYSEGDRNVPSVQSINFEIDSSGELVLDLCLQHSGEIAPILQNMVMLAHRKIDEDQAPKVRSHQCPRCDHAFYTRRNLAQHLRGIHHISLTEIEMGNGRQTGVIDTSTGYRCPDCEFVAANPQGLGAHRRSRHGTIGTSTTAINRREDQEQLVS